ncbi:MAG TPA: glycoside hydrolase family 2 TIM barrel-domain containing protein [Fimbriimonadaceae bacterium]|nr:glycoside hydrolase family 2 TIM barrel-domain containing protein [Fimbriimonadaceae bacterium]
MHLRGMARLFLIPLAAASASAAIAQPKLVTPWAAKVDAERPHPEYPRPQMVRQDWLSLNGRWDFGIGETPTYGRKIVVPFPIESHLSGVAATLGPREKAHYRRTFEIPPAWRGKRLILHFGAVDWEARVRLNGKEAGGHRGGYDPFWFDVTHLLASGPEQTLEVEVTDPTDASWQPRGKQVLKPGGIFYTPTSGIWQSVWIEPVSDASVESMRITPDLRSSSARVGVSLRSTRAAHVVAEALDGGRVVARAQERPDVELVLRIPRPKVWSPERPFLYGLRISVVDEQGRILDRVDSYFGMRSISVQPDSAGLNRLHLNGRPLFQIGLLDQGFWPDGLYTAPTDEALRYDLEVTKRLGFNMVRKHVKVEPARWYYHCDRLGLLVWQDMPSGDRYIGGADPDVPRAPESAANFEFELSRMIRSLYNHPSVVMWVVFNEGWGQYDTARIAGLTGWLDPTRLLNMASGWTDRAVGHVIDYHVYPGPGSPRPEVARAAVLGEFGGLGLPLSGHTWLSENNWGYRSFTSREALTDALVQNIRQLRPLIASPGLSAAVYTQTTDVETEVNGLLTYDRAVLKPNEAALKEAIASVFRPFPRVVEVVPTAEAEPVAWRYTLQEPPKNWVEPKFDDSGWSLGPAGFGRSETPGAVVRTSWQSNDIWIRRRFRLDRPSQLQDPHLKIHHDEDAEVYLDGNLIATLRGYTTSYTYVPIPRRLLTSLTAGEHVLAVHCRQTRGGQYIDVGLVDLVERR